ncbi:hypothetical protein LG302_06015 [Halomonas organivorans]
MILRLLPLALATSLIALPAFAQEDDADSAEPTVEESQAVEFEAETETESETAEGEDTASDDTIVVEESEAAVTLEAHLENEDMPDAAEFGLETAYEAVTTGGVGVDGDTVSAEASEGRSLEAAATAGERGATASATAGERGAEASAAGGDHGGGAAGSGNGGGAGGGNGGGNGGGRR